MRTFQVALALTVAMAMAGCGGKKDDGAMSNNTGTAGGDTAATGTTGDTARPSPTVSQGQTPAAMSDANIFAKMGMTDSMEVEAAKIALAKTKSADIKEFANMMVAEHGKMKAEGAALATRLGITPMLMADDPGAMQMGAMMQQLNAAPDAATFDRIYVEQMVVSHQQTLDFLGRAATEAQADSLQALIEKARPVVQMHLQHSQGMMAKVAGAPVSQ